MAQPGLNAAVRSLRSLLTYGLMGLAAYTEHAYVLDHTDDDIPAFVQEVASTINDEATVDDLVGMVVRCGQVGVQAMALLDQPNTSAYEHPEPTQGNLGVREGPAILVSGHDLRDLDELLQRTASKGQRPPPRPGRHRPPAAPPHNVPMLNRGGKTGSNDCQPGGRGGAGAETAVAPSLASF